MACVSGPPLTVKMMLIVVLGQNKASVVRYIPRQLVDIVKGHVKRGKWSFARAY